MEYMNIMPVVNAKSTLTTGSNAYMVAFPRNTLQDIEWENFQIVRANSEEEAVNKYNKLNQLIGCTGVSLGPVS